MLLGLFKCWRKSILMMYPDTHTVEKKKITMMNRFKSLFSKKQQRPNTDTNTYNDAANPNNDSFAGDTTFTKKIREKKNANKYSEDASQPYPDWMLEEFGQLEQENPGNKSVVVYEKFSSPRRSMVHMSDYSTPLKGEVHMSDTNTPRSGFVCRDKEYRDSERLPSKRAYKLPGAHMDSSPKKYARYASDEEGTDPHSSNSDYTISEFTDVKILSTVTEKPEMEEDDDFHLFPKSSFAYRIGAHDLPNKAIETPGFPRDQPYYAIKRNVQSDIDTIDDTINPSFPADEPYYIKRKRAKSQEIIERKKQYSSKRKRKQTNNDSLNGLTLSINDKQRIKDVTSLSTELTSNIESGYIKVICPICPKDDDSDPDLPQASPEKIDEILKNDATSHKPPSKPLFFGDGGSNKNIFSLLSSHPVPTQIQRYKNKFTNELPLGINSMSSPGYYKTFDPWIKPYSCPVFSRDNVDLNASDSESAVSLDSRFSNDPENIQRKDYSGTRTPHLSGGVRTPCLRETPSEYDRLLDHRKHYRTEGLESVSGSTQNDDTENTSSVVDWLVSIASCIGFKPDVEPKSIVHEKAVKTSYQSVNRRYPPFECGEDIVRKSLQKYSASSVPQIRSETIQRKSCYGGRDCVTSKSSYSFPPSLAKKERQGELLRKPLSSSVLCKTPSQSGWLPSSKSSVSILNSNSISSKCSSLSKSSSSSSRSSLKNNLLKRPTGKVKNLYESQSFLKNNLSHSSPWIDRDKSPGKHKRCRSGTANKASAPREKFSHTQVKYEPKKVFKTPKSKFQGARKFIGTETKYDERSKTEYITLMFSKDN